MIPRMLITPASTHLRRILVFVISVPLIVSGFACAKHSRSVATLTSEAQMNQNAGRTSSERIKINTATAKELEALPGIGKGLAERIIEHRQRYGPFAKPEHLIMVRGISEHRFQAIRDLITVE